MFGADLLHRLDRQIVQRALGGATGAGLEAAGGVLHPGGGDAQRRNRHGGLRAKEVCE